MTSMAKVREMEKEGLYPTLYDNANGIYMVMRHAEVKVIPHMPIIERYGKYWHRWP